MKKFKLVIECEQIYLCDKECKKDLSKLQKCTSIVPLENDFFVGFSGIWEIEKEFIFNTISELNEYIVNNKLKDIIILKDNENNFKLNARYDFDYNYHYTLEKYNEEYEEYEEYEYCKNFDYNIYSNIKIKNGGDTN